MKTKTLTEWQKEYLVEAFFKNEKYASWKYIAEKLVNGDPCIVAGTERIWIGGIGNFITCDAAPPQYIDCMSYTFDLASFLSSEIYKDISNMMLDRLHEKRIAICEQILMIENLI